MGKLLDPSEVVSKAPMGFRETSSYIGDVIQLNLDMLEQMKKYRPNSKFKGSVRKSAVVCVNANTKFWRVVNKAFAKFTRVRPQIKPAKAMKASRTKQTVKKAATMKASSSRTRR